MRWPEGCCPWAVAGEVEAAERGQELEPGRESGQEGAGGRGQVHGPKVKGATSGLFWLLVS